MKTPTLVRNYYVLPCCLLLLNLGIELADYKTKALGDPLLRTAAMMAMVVVGGALVGYVMTPAINLVVHGLHRGSRKSGGAMGELIFLLVLGAVIFWLYYRVYILGPQSVLPRDWWNSPLR